MFPTFPQVHHMREGNKQYRGTKELDKIIQAIFLFKLTWEAFAGNHFQNQTRGKLLECVRPVLCPSPSGGADS